MESRRQGEIISRTAATVLVRLEYGAMERYRLSDGLAHGRRDRDRIAAADMERIRAMPVGENGVSRALKKLEEKRPLKVKLTNASPQRQLGTRATMDIWSDYR